MQRATTLNVLTPLAILAILFASETFAAESWQPIILTAGHVCECSPATTISSPETVNVWRPVEVAASGSTRSTGFSSALAPRLQPATRNLAPQPVTVVQDPVPGMTPLPGPTVRVLRPVISPAVPPSQYRLGTGLIGQPKLYVPGQPIRNFIRYLSP